MNAKHVDALTRTISSRRIALGGLLGGGAALLGLALPEEVTAHNFLPVSTRSRMSRNSWPAGGEPGGTTACSTPAIRGPMRSPPAPGAAGPRSTPAASRSAVLPVEMASVAGPMARAAACTNDAESCLPDCACLAFPSTGGLRHYFCPFVDCSEIPVPCTSTATCPVGHVCLLNARDGEDEPHRCIPVQG